MKKTNKQIEQLLTDSLRLCNIEASGLVILAFLNNRGIFLSVYQKFQTQKEKIKSQPEKVEELLNNEVELVGIKSIPQKELIGIPKITVSEMEVLLQLIPIQ